MHKTQVNLQENDTTNLYNFFLTLLKNKWTAILTTLGTTLLATIYAWTVTPVYQGDVLLEIGSVIINSDPTNNKPTLIQQIESPSDLKEVLFQNLTSINERKKNLFTIESPKGNTVLIRISYEGTNKEKISEKLQKAVDFTLKRHHDKAIFFENNTAQVSQTKVVGTVEISEDPVKPKKKLIVILSIVIGFIFGIFLVFLKEWIGTLRKTNNEEQKASTDSL
jgi:LPS O-antigen subunit length determinant protein (WzzB/FepE family)